MLLTILQTTLFASLMLSAPRTDLALALGPWRAWLDCPGGEMPFGLELEADDPNGLRAFILNGSERIAIPRVEVTGDTLLLEIDHYDSRLRARISEDGRRLDGEWKKRRGSDRWGVMPFHATAGGSPRFTSLEGVTSETSIDGRWSIDFEGDEGRSTSRATRSPRWRCSKPAMTARR